MPHYEKRGVISGFMYYTLKTYLFYIIYIVHRLMAHGQIRVSG